MTPQEMIDVIQAHADGKQIEWHREGMTEWRACDGPPVWNFATYTYRIKPLELRPHWPAIFRVLNGPYMLTGMYANEAEAGRVIGLVRLATEYPPVMLP